jgi:hypothetical protein
MFHLHHNLQQDDDAPRLNNSVTIQHKPQNQNLVDEAIQRGVEDIEID